MNKRPHKLRGNKKTSFPRKVFFYDCETIQVPLNDTEIEQVFWFVCVNYVDYQSKSVDETRFFFRIEDFWDYIESKTASHHTVTLLAHNADFDFRILKGSTSLSSRGWILNKCIVDGGKFIMSWGREEATGKNKVGKDGKNCKVPRKYIQCLDTLNWFKESLAKLGQTIGIAKLSMPVCENNMVEWAEYCEQDVVVMRKAYENFTAFIESHDLGNLGYTLAKQAFNAFRHRFMKHDIFIHADERAIDLERKAYFGGRTECFRIGKFTSGHYYKFDINSMYPHVMKNCPYPVQCTGNNLYWTPERMKRARKEGLIIADCTVRMPVPAVPYRHNHKLCFPVGTFRTALCSPELDLLDKMKVPYVIHAVNFYEKAFIFSDYIDYMYRLRWEYKDSGNKQYEYFIKLLMNSLYGKFGQRNIEWKFVEKRDTLESWIEEIYNEKGEVVEREKCIAGNIFKDIGMQEGFDSFVAVSAFVTSYARVYLWELMELAGRENVFYVDTDSLFVNEIGKNRLESKLDNRELGLLKLEAESDKLIIYNLKDYEFGEETKIKGINKKAVKLDDTTFDCEQWEHYSGAMRKKHPETVITRHVIKKLAREYGKGTVLADGSIVPYEFDERFQSDK